MSQQRADVPSKSQPIVTVVSSEQPSRPLLATLDMCASNTLVYYYIAPLNKLAESMNNQWLKVLRQFVNVVILSIMFP